jgi:hypothetical protein
MLRARCRQARVQVVATWTGSSADALRRALRMTIEQFAAQLDAAPRTVAGWRQKPGTVPQAAIQEALDAALERASDREKAQFAELFGTAEPAIHAIDNDQPLGLPLVPAPRPEFGDSEYLHSIQRHIREIVALDNRFGAADILRLSMRFFRTLHDQLGAGTYDTSLERDLQSAAGELAEVAAYLSAQPAFA